MCFDGVCLDAAFGDVKDRHGSEARRPGESRPVRLRLPHRLMDLANLQPVHPPFQGKVETNQRIRNPDSLTLGIRVLGAVRVNGQLMKSAELGGMLQLEAGDLAGGLPAFGGRILPRVCRQPARRKNDTAPRTDGDLAHRLIRVSA